MSSLAHRSDDSCELPQRLLELVRRRPRTEPTLVELDQGITSRTDDDVNASSAPCSSRAERALLDVVAERLRELENRRPRDAREDAEVERGVKSVWP